MIFASFFKAVSQLPDPRFRRVMLLGIGLTVALLVGTYAALLWVVQTATADGVSIPWIGNVGWIGDLLGWGGLGVIILMSIFLMIPAASAITSFFLDDVADAVEAKHFPHLPPAPEVPFIDALRDTVLFFGVLVGANLLAIIAYGLLPFFAVPIFYALNGFLLGREYFTIAATRREGREGARNMRRKYLPQIWMADILMALPLTIPLMNLFIPILGAATFTHLYYRLAGQNG